MTPREVFDYLPIVLLAALGIGIVIAGIMLVFDLLRAVPRVYQGLFCAFVAGFGVFFAGNWLVNRGVKAQLMREKGARGNIVQANRSERMSEAIVRAMALKKEGVAVKDILKTVAGEFPDVAIQLAAKVINGKIKGLEGLI